jgi:hypothetical protein
MPIGLPCLLENPLGIVAFVDVGKTTSYER